MTAEEKLVFCIKQRHRWGYAVSRNTKTMNAIKDQRCVRYADLNSLHWHCSRRMKRVCVLCSNTANIAGSDMYITNSVCHQRSFLTVFFALRFILNWCPMEKEILEIRLSEWMFYDAKSCFVVVLQLLPFMSLPLFCLLQDKDISSHPREPCTLWTSCLRMA